MKKSNEVLASLLTENPSISAASLSRIGRSLIIAPHPDDESLACGGTIALLRKNQFPVYVIFVTDGSKSHPNSRVYPSDKLRDLREVEAKNALTVLGVPSSEISFLRLPDSKLNEIPQYTYQQTTKKIQKLIKAFRPNTIFAPWRQDPHPDHIASWHLLMDTVNRRSLIALHRPILLEYLLWFWERTNPDKVTFSNTTKIWKVDITPVLRKKATAIQQHKSQLGKIITDDPKGFSLPPSLLHVFRHSEEFFLEYEGKPESHA